jgi:23S rRNA (cytidine1920-2'-O)/16S rRNA (cytidine1409-2'-O)-methyltransferase
MRADLYLTVLHHTVSRQQAKRLIEEGCVTIDGKLLKKPAEEISEGAHSVEIKDSLAYVSRGGLKLEAALDAFSIDVTGKRAIDIGASTGGFTDCLLQRGVLHVWAIDSGDGQLASSLRDDLRVTSIERCNARYLTLEEIGAPVDLIVMDVSFISATYLIPRFPELLGACGDAVCLIKPPFEVGRARIGKGGIVKDPSAHRSAIEKVLSCGRENGLSPIGLIPSPVKGGDGNREFLVHFTLQGDGEREISDQEIRRVVG